jgi:hypothetical protein
MVKRGTRIALSLAAGVAGAIAGAAVGGTWSVRRQVERMDRLGVTLYSEPHYRGARLTVPCAEGLRDVRALAETGLPQVGSIKVQRFTRTIRPALLHAPAMWAWARGAFFSLITTDTRGAAEQGQTAASFLRGLLTPRAWRVERELTEHVWTWVRLWADQPVDPPPPGDERWHDIRTDTADLGPWRTRTRHLELGVSVRPS